ncbi:hypothetical protein MOE45_13290 [Bacillus atrophaeus]|nr:hypothetical protein [Bacillus atrophaeus]
MLKNLKKEIELLEHLKATLIIEMGKQNFNELSDLLVAEIQKRDLPPHLLKEFFNYQGRIFRLAHVHEQNQQ